MSQVSYYLKELKARLDASRAIPVGERLPEQWHFGGECDGESFEVLAFQWNTEQWCEAVYCHNTKKWRTFDDWHAADWITYWMPMPPIPPRDST